MSTRHGPSSDAIPSVRRFLRIQLHHGSCWRSPSYTTQDNCRSAASMPAKGSKIPASVKHGSPRESSRSEPSDLVQLGRSVVIVAGEQNAGSACAGSRVGGRARRQYVWLRVGRLAPDFRARSVPPGTVDLACSGADPSLQLDRSGRAIRTACWSKQTLRIRARYRSPSRCSGTVGVARFGYARALRRRGIIVSGSGSAVKSSTSRLKRSGFSIGAR